MSDWEKGHDGPDGNDYIFRGNPSTPQDGEPWNPPASPPSPPEPAPYPTSPPPGFPPQQPPMGQAVPGMEPVAPKKKRWPWIVAGVIVLCALPLGGCVALIGFGFSEINSRVEQIESTVDDYYDGHNAGDAAKSNSRIDGETPCMSADSLDASISELGVPLTWTVERTGFVERSGNSTLSSNADAETLFIDGRPDESAAVVTGTLSGTNGTRDVQILLSRPLSSWRICTITTR